MQLELGPESIRKCAERRLLASLCPAQEQLLPVFER
jgi:hypothetical protein